MESSRARIAGPAVAAGAVSVGLVLIGMFGIEREDTYVAPPPLKSDPYAGAPMRDDGGETGSGVPRITIPPSPSWQIAPAGPPRRPAGYTLVVDPSADPSDDPSATESATRTRTPTTRPREAEPTTTRTRTLTLEPSTPAGEEPSSELVEDEPYGTESTE
ncbi:hypothetical protein [Nocardia asteroides]|uniref:hypothetical protein n=1 Tax=Nocardia asteroides TaxID=1824 RepID=UPI001E5B7B18|nr:hypothetical protein [Nocardia asteroides]UGT64156.1 hypothetical protein LTT61_13025 [Nocardia asteroides]